MSLRGFRGQLAGAAIRGVTTTGAGGPARTNSGHASSEQRECPAAKHGAPLSGTTDRARACGVTAGRGTVGCPARSVEISAPRRRLSRGVAETGAAGTGVRVRRGLAALELHPAMTTPISAMPTIPTISRFITTTTPE